MNNNLKNPTQNLGLVMLISVLAIGSFTLIFSTLKLQQNGTSSSNFEPVNTYVQNANINILTSSSSLATQAKNNYIPPPSVGISSADSKVVTKSTIALSTATSKDGDYQTNSISYSVPSGQNKLSISNLTLKGDIVTDLTFTNDYSGRGSARYDNKFQTSIKSKVVGKKLKDISNVYVSGASLTSEAFDSALQSVIAQSKI